MRWSRRGVWQRVSEEPAAETDNEYAQIEITIIQAHQHSAGAKKGNCTKECIGRSSGGLTTKIHATCDALGNPTGFHLSPGQAHNLQGADVLLEALLDQIKAPASGQSLRSKSKAFRSLGGAPGGSSDSTEV